MKRVATIQSSYIPWKGYFDIIHDVDLFIFLDDVQYTRNDWRNRNRVKSPDGPRWLTIPVGGKTDRLICEVRLPESDWAQDHYRVLCQYYGKAPFFEKYRPWLEEVYLGRTWTYLSELNQHLVTTIFKDFLGGTTEFRDSREFASHGWKLERLMDLLDKAGAGLYVSGPSARDYIDPAAFKQAGIELVFKDYSGYPDYSQPYPPFSHQVTILDLLLNVGPESPYYVWGWRETGSRPAH